MKGQMSKFKLWVLEYLINEAVSQLETSLMFKMIRIAAEKEYYEDNLITLNSFLRGRFEDSLRKSSM